MMAESSNRKDTEHPSDRPGPSRASGPPTPPIALASSLPPGTGLGKYRILERIRTTQNAIAYRARDAMLDRLVTIKQLNPALIDSPIACGNMKREAQLLARMPKDARQIVNIHELIEDEQGLFLVEEYIQGDRLELLISKRHVDVTDALRLLKSACLGLHTLHVRRIVHRNICPNSLIVSANGSVRITDFSAAAHEGDIGVPDYLDCRYAAPELQAGAAHDTRVDLYSLGFAMYEVCVGRRALAKHFASVLEASASQPPLWKQWHTNLDEALPQASTLNPAVPPALDAILDRMTAKDLDARFTNAKQVIKELVKDFSVPRPHTAWTLPGPHAGRIIEIRQPSVFLGVAPLPSGALMPPGLMMGSTWPLQQDQSTTTHAITSQNAPSSQATRPQDGRPIQPAVSRQLRPEPIGRRPNALMPYRAARPVPRLIAPTPSPTHESHQRTRSWRLMALVACVVLCTIGLLVAQFVLDAGPEHDAAAVELRALLDQGINAYEDGNYDDAYQDLSIVSIRTFENPDFAEMQARADEMLLMVEGQQALASGNFDKAEKILARAEIRSSDLLALDAFRRKLEGHKTVRRLAAKGDRDLENKKFLDVERDLDEYEKSAKAAGLDASLLRDKLDRTRNSGKYERALARARDALAERDFDAAIIDCKDAQRLRRTSESRELLGKILDAQKHHDWVLRGDKAMRDNDFADAEEAYGSANAIEPSDETEQKLCVAAAARMRVDAMKAYQQGDLLKAERLLKNSLWKSDRPGVAKQLERLSPAFDAARIVQTADQAASRGDHREALRLYRKALSDLPSPSDETVRQKILKAQTGAATQSSE
jgi:serine/threonine protein kinase/tetratricopeptide (TPR) repeat protein